MQMYLFTEEKRKVVLVQAACGSEICSPSSAQCHRTFNRWLISSARLHAFTVFIYLTYLTSASIRREKAGQASSHTELVRGQWWDPILIGKTQVTNLQGILWKFRFYVGILLLASRCYISISQTATHLSRHTNSSSCSLLMIFFL